MTALTVSAHAALRLAQRGIPLKDAELILLIGTEIDDGYLVRAKDYQEIEHVLRRLLARLRRLVGKRLVIVDGRVITAYHASKHYERELLRSVQDADRRSCCTDKRSHRHRQLDFAINSP
jgi:hypothetical protein